MARLNWAGVVFIILLLGFCTCLGVLLGSWLIGLTAGLFISLLVQVLP